jgi:hypothetical protein
MITRGFTKGTILTRGLGISGVIEAMWKEVYALTVRMSRIVKFNI